MTDRTSKHQLTAGEAVGILARCAGYVLPSVKADQLIEFIGSIAGRAPETGTAHASLAKRWTALADLYEREGIAPGVVELARESALALHPKTPADSQYAPTDPRTTIRKEPQ